MGKRPPERIRTGVEALKAQWHRRRKGMRGRLQRLMQVAEGELQLAAPERIDAATAIRLDAARRVRALAAQLRARPLPRGERIMDYQGWYLLGHYGGILMPGGDVGSQIAHAHRQRGGARPKPPPPYKKRLLAIARRHRKRLARTGTLSITALARALENDPRTAPLIPPRRRQGKMNPPRQRPSLGTMKRWAKRALEE